MGLVIGGSGGNGGSGSGGGTTQIFLGNHVKSKSTTYEVLGSLIFRGTDILGTPSNMKTIAFVTDASKPGDMRLFDKDNSLQIAEVTGIANLTSEIIDMGTISNLPTGEAIFEIQLKVPLGTGKEEVMATTLLVEP